MSTTPTPIPAPADAGTELNAESDSGTNAATGRSGAEPAQRGPDSANGTGAAASVSVSKHPTRRNHWLLSATQWLPRPVDEVWPFFADAHNLESITPGFLKFNVLTPKPIEMHAGRLIDYRLRVRGLPIRWRTEIAEWEPPRRFADTQLRGPYVTWYHVHAFEPLDGGTLCRDEVTYAPPGGPLRPLVNALAVQRDVRSIFEHRQRVLGEMFG